MNDSYRWRVIYPDREQLVIFAKAVTTEEALARYPGAVAVELPMAPAASRLPAGDDSLRRSRVAPVTDEGSAVDDAVTTETVETTAGNRDWDAIRHDYESGAKPIRQIGSERGISHVAILKRAKRAGWVRPDRVTSDALTKQVTAETDSETQGGDVADIVAGRDHERRDAVASVVATDSGVELATGGLRSG